MTEHIDHFSETITLSIMNNTPTLSSTERVDDFARHLAAILRRLVSEQEPTQETHQTIETEDYHATTNH